MTTVESTRHCSTNKVTEDSVDDGEAESCDRQSRRRFNALAGLQKEVMEGMRREKAGDHSSVLMFCGADDLIFEIDGWDSIVKQTCDKGVSEDSEEVETVQFVAQSEDMSVEEWCEPGAIPRLPLRIEFKLTLAISLTLTLTLTGGRLRQWDSSSWKSHGTTGPVGRRIPRSCSIG